MRLTYKYEKCSGYGSIKVKNLPPDPLVNKLPYLDNIWEEERNKLGQLEDIEDELGIDLITFFKLLKATKVWAYSNNGKWEVQLTSVDIYDKTVNLWNGTCHIKYPLSEYGKSFALTKEELL